MHPPTASGKPAKSKNNPARFVLPFAALVLIGLRLLGRILQQQTVPEVASQAPRLLWSGFALAVISGTLMFIGNPRLARASVALSLVLWFAVSMAGRAIGASAAASSEPALDGEAPEPEQVGTARYTSKQPDPRNHAAGPAEADLFTPLLLSRGSRAKTTPR